MTDARADAAFAARGSNATSRTSASPARAPRGPVEDATTRRSGQAKDDNHAKDDDDDESALVVLKYNLAQNELRGMVNTLFSALEAHERREDVSKKEAVELKEKYERWKQEARLEREQARQQVQQYQHDLVWANQQLQQAQMGKGEQETENQRLKTQLEEKDKTIDRLNHQLSELVSKQHEGLKDGGALGSELEQVAADFSRKEREVYNNMVLYLLALDHVRKATSSLQQQGKDMSSQINSLQTQLADIKELYAECRTFFECKHVPPVLDAKQTDAATGDDVSRLEQENEHLKVKNQVLTQRCKHFGDELNGVKNQIAELVQENASLKKLVAKFEQSAEDGTQTIECLQDSLMKLCDQITSERHHHESTLGGTIEATREKERRLVQDIEQLQQKIHAIENKAEANTLSLILKQLEADRHNYNLEAPFDQSKTSQESHEVHKELRGVHRDTDSQTRSSAAASHRTFPLDPAPRINETTESIDDIEDIDDDEVSTVKSASKPRTITTTHAKTPSTTPAKMQPVTTMCRSCGEEPFGFMVKCQKCKDPFHAGVLAAKTDESDTTREIALSDPRRVFKTVEATCNTIANHTFYHNERTSCETTYISLAIG